MGPNKTLSKSSNIGPAKKTCRLTRSKSKEMGIDLSNHEERSAKTNLSPTKRGAPYWFKRTPSFETKRSIQYQPNNLNKSSNASCHKTTCNVAIEMNVSSLPKGTHELPGNTVDSMSVSVSASSNWNYVTNKVADKNHCESACESTCMSLDEGQAEDLRQLAAMETNHNETSGVPMDKLTPSDCVDMEKLENKKLKPNMLYDATHTMPSLTDTVDFRRSFPPHGRQASECSNNLSRKETTKSLPALSNDSDIETDVFTVTCVKTSPSDTRPERVPRDFVDDDATFTFINKRRPYFAWIKTTQEGYDHVDGITSMCTHTSCLDNPPEEVPNDYTDGPAKCPWVKKDDKESPVFIKHKHATDDKALGDRFGVSLWTDSSAKKDGYYRHFFVNVEEQLPADNMKIRNKDEIVLINDHFVPDLTHEKVLELFRDLPVDGVTRLILIIRRKATPRYGTETSSKLEWFKTSAILVPELNEEPKATHLQYKKLRNNMYDRKTWQRYKVSGTQSYLTLDSRGMGVGVIHGDQTDKAKLIYKHSIVCDDEHDHLEYLASLQCADEKNFAFIEEGRNVISTSTEEIFFRWRSNGTEVFFQQNDMYINCTTRGVCASTECQWIEECAMPGNKDILPKGLDSTDSSVATRVTRSMTRQPSETTQCQIHLNCLSL